MLTLWHEHRTKELKNKITQFPWVRLHIKGDEKEFLSWMKRILFYKIYALP